MIKRKHNIKRMVAIVTKENYYDTPECFLHIRKYINGVMRYLMLHTLFGYSVIFAKTNGDVDIYRVDKALEQFGRI